MKGVIVSLGKNIEIVFKKEKIRNEEIMVAVGVLIQMLTVADKQDKSITKERYKEMIANYIDAVWSGEEDVN